MIRNISRALAIGAAVTLSFALTGPGTAHAVGTEISQGKSRVLCANSWTSIPGGHRRVEVCAYDGVSKDKEDLGRQTQGSSTTIDYSVVDELDSPSREITLAGGIMDATPASITMPLLPRSGSIHASDANCTIDISASNAQLSEADNELPEVIQTYRGTTVVEPLVFSLYGRSTKVTGTICGIPLPYPASAFLARSSTNLIFVYPDLG